MRTDIIKLIASAKGVTHAVVLTHNIDFLFVQSVVLPALRECGSPSLTIFADAGCAAETYQQQHTFLSGLGRRYRVVPITMRPGFRFHPKAVLLSGPSAAELVIGSGNLTFGGWSENGEVWQNFLSKKKDDLGVLAEFHQYLGEVLDLAPETSKAVRASVEEAFAPETRKWAKELPTSHSLLRRAGQGSSLSDQIRRVVGDGAVSHLTVCTPYFDPQAQGLRNLAADLSADKTTVLVQSGRSNLTAPAANGLSSAFRIQNTTFRHEETVGTEKKIREAFLHAKFFAVQQQDRVHLFLGSANCSIAALTLAGGAGNAELLVHREMSSKQFQSDFLDELVIEDAPPELGDAIEPEPSPDEEVGELIIQSASMTPGRIDVHFQAQPNLEITETIVENASVPPTATSSSQATFSTNLQPQFIVLVGHQAGQQLRSQPHWIDDEFALEASARGRSLANAMHAPRDGSWDIGSWTLVLSELHKHLQYMPKVGSTPGNTTPHRDTSKASTLEFEWQDVFAGSYGLPLARSAELHLHDRALGIVDSISALLLRWFGVVSPEREAQANSDEANVPDYHSDTPEDYSSQAGDRPSIPPPPLSEPASPTTREKKRISRLVEQMLSQLTGPQHLSERRPDLLAADLKVAAILLRVGLAKGWMSEQEFYDATLRIWMPLFFNAEKNDYTGWIEQRYLTTPDPVGFAQGIRSVELAATLGCWALTPPKRIGSVDHAQFELASALSVARLPWLWQTGGNEAVASRIAELLGCISPNVPVDYAAIEERWLTLIRRGFALNQMEKTISRLGLTALRERIEQETVEEGELLWQGRFGFCVMADRCRREDNENEPVLVLRQQALRNFRGQFLVPVKSLLNPTVLPNGDLSDNCRKELSSFLEALRPALHPRNLRFK